jgi:hypothetical protein
LGKEFSANVFNDLFNGKSPGADLSDNKIDLIDVDKKTGESFNPELEIGISQNQGSGLGGIFDLFTPDSSVSDEIAEQNLTRQMKKKQKRQRRL